MTFFLSSWFKNVSDDLFYFNIILDLMNIHYFFRNIQKVSTTTNLKLPIMIGTLSAYIYI